MPTEKYRRCVSIVFRFSGVWCRGFSYRFGCDVFCVLGFRVFLLVSSCPPPPISAGAGLGNQAAILWHRTRLRSVFRVFFSVSSCRSPHTAYHNIAMTRKYRDVRPAWYPCKQSRILGMKKRGRAHSCDASISR